MKYDYIIVGQGIAGSVLSYFLLQQNKNILVIDKSHPSSASNIAAGVVNPITGRRMVKSWMIDEILPFAKSTYKKLEKELNASFFFEQDIYKILTSEEDITTWNEKKSIPEYENYLGDIIQIENKSVNAKFGVGIIKQACWMDVPHFIKLYRNSLIEKNLLLEEELDFEQLHISDTVHYKEYTADKIIFCEGYKAYKNPFFSFIPFSLAKGEQLLIHAKDLQSDKLLNKNIFMLPKKNDYYSVGSTFIWNDMEETVTESGRADLMEKIDKIISCSYEIIEEKAGIRPTIKDRRPVIGTHPENNNILIFNGMGTKGVSLTPYFAYYFTEKMHKKLPLMPEISINRFWV